MRRICVSTVLLCLLLGNGCDRVAFRSEASVSRPSELQSSAARTRLTTDGIERLYLVRWRDGVPIERQASQVELSDQTVQLGPIASTAALEDWSVSTTADNVDLSAVANDLSLLVPLRFDTGVGTRICRFRVAARRSDLSVEVTTRFDAKGVRLEPDSDEEVAFTDAETTLVGDCPPYDALDDEVTTSLDQAIFDYANDALSQAWREAAAVEPARQLGLLSSGSDVEHLSPFDTRRGRMSIFSTSTASASALGADGMELDFDMAVRASRADCVPPVDIDLPAAQTSPADIPPSALESQNADLGYALSTRMLSALAQNSVRAGFACTGLEDAPLSDSSQGAVATEDLMLDQVGLDAVPAGSYAVPVIAPGQLPSVTTRPENGVIEVEWSDLTIEIYSEIRGVPSRILELTTSATVSLEPERATGGFFEVQVGSVDIAQTELVTRWLQEEALAPDLSSWTRRLLLLLFEERLQIPLPFEPGAPLEFTGTQVRSDDVLFFLEVDL